MQEAIMSSGLVPERRGRSKKDALRDLAFALRLHNDASLRARHLTLSTHQTDELAHILIQQYFKDDQEYLASPEGNGDFFDHLIDRLADNRRRVVPWFNRISRLDGLRILEIGSGTGSSAVAFAEQGAQLTGIDIDEPSLEVARRRCALYGLGSVELEWVNIADEHPVFARRYDLIVFFASLEHMLHEERLEGLRKTWAMLGSGGLLGVIECPNRLWFFDDHTAWLPFFHWLPDRLAMEYSRRSPRPSLRAEGAGTSIDTFLRYGRGVSFHEFELALVDLKTLQIAGELESFLQRWYPAFYLRHRFSLAHSYERFLRKVAPGVHAGFFRPSLNIVLRKP